MTCQMMNCFLCEAPPLKTRDNPAMQKPVCCTGAKFAVRERIETESECGAPPPLEGSKWKQMKAKEAHGSRRVSKQQTSDATGTIVGTEVAIFLVLVQTDSIVVSLSGWSKLIQKKSSDGKIQIPILILR